MLVVILSGSLHSRTEISFFGFQNCIEGTQLKAGSALDALLLVDLVLLIPGFNRFDGAVSKAAPAGDALVSNTIHR